VFPSNAQFQPLRYIPSCIATPPTLTHSYLFHTFPLTFAHSHLFILLFILLLLLPLPLLHLLTPVCAEFINKAKIQELARIKGPIRIPTKVLLVTTRCSPCGEGTNTWDRFEMRIHKRIIDLVTTPNNVKAITSIKIEHGVEVDVVIMKSRN
jgi:ribosomal protein uS10